MGIHARSPVPGDWRTLQNPSGRQGLRRSSSILRWLPPGTKSVLFLWHLGQLGKSVIVLFVCFTVCGLGLTLREYGTDNVTPLSIDNWTDVETRANNLSVKIKKRKWQTLGTSEWPSFQTGWPPEGSFLISKIEEVKDRVYGFRGPGHLDRGPYIAAWEDLVTDPPLYGSNPSFLLQI